MADTAQNARKSGHVRRTKIVATIGPASESPEMIRALIQAGMNVARVNFSHGEQAANVALIKRIHAMGREMGQPIAVLQDLCGPKLRVGKMQGDGVTLVEGQRTVITVDECEGTAERFSASYSGLPTDVTKGDRLLLDDGKLELRVESAKGWDVVCTVVRGGLLKSKKGLNLPGVKLSTPSVTEKDMSDLRAGVQAGVDFVGLSFVRAPEDVTRVKQFLEKSGADVRVIAKIEKPEAIAQMDDIVEATDGIMVARGDLGVEIPIQEVPPIQKRLVRLCNHLDRPVIVATQMLESMMTSLQPNRAEVSDIANAIFDGTDAVMLSGETATGRYPVEAVRMMHQIAVEAEEYLLMNLGMQRMTDSVPNRLLDTIGRAAFRIVEDLDLRLIIASSRTGGTALYMSKSRPRAMILGATTNEAAWRRMNLYWAVVPALCVREAGMPKPEFIEAATKVAREMGLARAGEYAVVVSATPVCTAGAVANAIEVVKIGS
jgi:pyruvate kinase